jgi:hypothetical protein
MLFVLKTTYLNGPTFAEAWQVLARLADIRQPVLVGLDTFVDIRQPVLVGLDTFVDIRQPTLPGLARLAHIRQRAFLRKM